MTYNELKAQVAHLGFERTVSDDDALFRATERALSIVHLDVLEISVKRIYLQAPRLTRVYPAFCHTGGRTDEYELFGTAFSFRPHGDGEFYVTNGGIEAVTKFTAAGGVVKGALVNGHGSIRFQGESDYVITALASFDGGHDMSLADVYEYSDRRAVKLSEMIGDFGYLSDSPVCVGGNMTGLELAARGDVLYVPFLLDGEVEVKYFRRPKSPEKSGESLDLPCGTEQLFPLLVASFIWLDDDEGKAQYYMALYRDGINRLKRITPSPREEKYVTNGWA